jgi:hypothetical protein
MLSKTAEIKHSTGESYLLPGSSQSCGRNRLHALHSGRRPYALTAKTPARPCNYAGLWAPLLHLDQGGFKHSSLHTGFLCREGHISFSYLGFTCPVSQLNRTRSCCRRSYHSRSSVSLSEHLCLFPAFRPSAQIDFSSSDMAETTTRWSNRARGSGLVHEILSRRQLRQKSRVRTL